MAILEPNAVFNGRYTTISLGDSNEPLAECYGNTAKTTINKETVPRCGSIYNCSVETSADNTGTIKLHKINAKLQKELAAAIAKGTWPTFTITEVEENPKTNTKITKIYYGVSFDTLDWANWSADALSGYEISYTFDRAEFK
jgi:hypothetical protein